MKTIEKFTFVVHLMVFSLVQKKRRKIGWLVNQWIVQNVEATDRASILSTTSVFAKISNRELPNV